MTRPVEDEIEAAQSQVAEAHETLEHLQRIIRSDLHRLEGTLLDLRLTLQQISRKAEEADRAAKKAGGMN
jgi:uncharacterized protein YukE